MANRRIKRFLKSFLRRHSLLFLPLFCLAGTIASRILVGRDSAVICRGNRCYHRVGKTHLHLPISRYAFRSIRNWQQKIESERATSEGYWFFNYKPAPGDTIIDIGAGNGEDIFAFRQAVGPTGRIIAVEAHPETFQQLQDLCKLNGFDNVTCINCAITGKNGIVTLFESDTYVANSMFGTGTGIASIVPALTLDTLCEALSLRSVSYLKMNIEGAENLAILGMDQTMNRTDFVTIACHDFRTEAGESAEFSTKEAILAFLWKHDFSLKLTRDIRSFVRDHIHATNPKTGNLKSAA